MTRSIIISALPLAAYLALAMAFLAVCGIPSVCLDATALQTCVNAQGR